MSKNRTLSPDNLRFHNLCAQPGDAFDAVLSLLLRADAAVSVDAVDAEKRRALHIASAAGNVRIAKLLLDLGSDINAVDKNLESALHLAARNYHVRTALFLIEKKIDRRIRNHQGKTFIEVGAPGFAHHLGLLFDNKAAQFAAKVHRAEIGLMVANAKREIENEPAFNVDETATTTCGE